MWFLLKEWLIYAFGNMFGFLEYLDKALVFWTFLAIGLTCGGFLFLTMIIGEISELFGDMFGGDADHDLGGGTEHGGSHDASDSGLDSHAPDFSTPSLFSFRIMMAFFTGFGLIGAVATYGNQSVIISSLWGLSSGALLMIATYIFVSYLASGQGSVNIVDSDLLGKEARVVVEIPPDGLGRVEIFTHAGSLTKLSRSLEGNLISENSIVRVEKISGNTVLVKKL
ncbi:MAG: hypothetical protein A3G49_03560 [Candidatus Sungbacteria bacterium RIFCSPLOWO2_12_FULL_41_11]|uniref:NfeD-like C-terminal domain-containing protein n=1 Tax=Candidatus Sungbacteria bacterium RIFCSPLOWO2_12_FULL_41_11 TaxID=1802286 RepID=A0A1G2LT41_9BACT|nr:MAG: hypothetical protein A3G49_03560 [Candidatus Sungbacteria bacterium RIFCSPLOWO2_12_FULL_41_11]